MSEPRRRLTVARIPFFSRTAANFATASLSEDEKPVSSTGFTGMFTAVIQDGLITNLSDTYNVGILIFLVVLGIIVVLMNKAGGSRAYGEWAAKHIKSRVGASLSTFLHTIF